MRDDLALMMHDSFKIFYVPNKRRRFRTAKGPWLPTQHTHIDGRNRGYSGSPFAHFGPFSPWSVSRNV